MQRLGRSLQRVREGQSATVLLAGEAGVGKTRLLTEFVTGACGAATVLVGGCLDLADGAPPYWAIMDALRGLPDADPPGSGQDQPARPGQPAQAELFGTVLRRLELAAARQPVVLAIEDLQWADRSTRDLLHFLVGTLRAHRVLFLASYRSEALQANLALQAWLAELLRGSQVELLELAPLTRGDVVRQIAGILGGPPRPEVAEAIWQRSEGNAFFAEELLASVVAGGQDLPPTLRQVLLARIGAVEDLAGQLLGIVAVAGSPVRHDLLVALGVLSEAEILKAVRTCVDHQILLVDTQANGYAFRHSLLRDAADGQLFPAERRALHRACARAIQGNPALAYGSAAAERALHWHRAGDPEQALEAALDAAEAAAASFGFPEALAHLERALGLWEQAPVAAGARDRWAVTLQAGEYANLAGDHARAAGLARAALQHLGPQAPAGRAAQAWERLGRYLWDAGASEDALVAYARSADLVAAEPSSPAGARLLAAQSGALMQAGRYQESRRRAEEALEVARRTGARREEAQVLAVLGFDLAYLGDAGGEHLLLESRRIALEDGDADGIARAYIALVTLLSEPLNRLTEAVAVADEGLAAVRRLGLERFHGVTLQAMAVNTLFRLGRWQEGGRRLQEAFGRDPAGSSAIDLHLARAKLTLSEGSFEQARADLDTVSRLSERAIDPRFRAPVLTLRAGMALWQGRLDDARAAVAAGLASLSASEEVWFAGPLAWHGLWAEADRADLIRSLRSEDQQAHVLATAGALLERLRQLIRRLDPAASAVHQSAALYLLMCQGEWSRITGASSPGTWEAAAATWDRMQQPYPASYARWRLAEALLSQRARSSAAAAPLRQGHTTAVAMGAVPLRDRLADLATRAGISLDAPVPPAAPGPPANPATKGAALGLTRRETEVLALVALGRTNREVATSLFISEKTASVHVSNILRKLSLRSRVEASGLAHRLGLLPDTAGDGKT